MRNFLAFTGFRAGCRPYFRERFKRSVEHRVYRVVQSVDNHIRLYIGNTLQTFNRVGDSQSLVGFEWDSKIGFGILSCQKPPSEITRR